MENLNAEQIKKALECCISGDDCTICPLRDEQSCPCVLNENALALIKSQEQRIKELTEENERLQKLCELRDRDYGDICELLFKAEDENEKLRAQIESHRLILNKLPLEDKPCT